MRRFGELTTTRWVCDIGCAERKYPAKTASVSPPAGGHLRVVLSAASSASCASPTSPAKADQAWPAGANWGQLGSAEAGYDELKPTEAGGGHWRPAEAVFGQARIAATPGPAMTWAICHRNDTPELTISDLSAEALAKADFRLSINNNRHPYSIVSTAWALAHSSALHTYRRWTLFRARGRWDNGRGCSYPPALPARERNAFSSGEREVAARHARAGTSRSE